MSDEYNKSKCHDFHEILFECSINAAEVVADAEVLLNR